MKRGQELVEIETDKANMTYESDQEGVLKTIAAEGDTLPVGAPIARVARADEASESAGAARRRQRAKTMMAASASRQPASVRSVPAEAAAGEVSPSLPQASPGEVGVREESTRRRW